MIENPTDFQLRELTGIVYLIKNNINQKCYIGKTIRRFVDRYSSCEWWKWTTNNYLLNSVKKFGKNNFQLSILIHGIKDDTQLLEIESKFIHEFNCLFPNGYNFLEETRKEKIFTDEMRLNMALSGVNGKIYKIKEIKTGKIREFRCPLEIKKEYNIKDQNLHALFAGKLRTLKGICLPETNTEKWEENDILKILIDQYENKYEFYNCNKFEREHGCPRGSVRRIICGEKFAVISKDGKIFRLKSTKLSDIKYLKSIGKIGANQKYKTIILTRIKDSKDFILNPKGTKKFCEDNHISRRDISALTGKEQKTSKGFKLKELIYL